MQECKKMQIRQKSDRKRCGHPLSFACVRLGRTSVRLLPGQIVRFRSHTSAFVRIRSLMIFLFIMNETTSGHTRQLLPGRDVLRRAPECVTANSPEYVTLEGLIHRDSPEYVTKKIYPSRMGWRSNQPLSLNLSPLVPRGARGPGCEGRADRRCWRRISFQKGRLTVMIVHA